MTFRQQLMDLEARLRPGEPPSIKLSLRSLKPVLSSSGRSTQRKTPVRSLQPPKVGPRFSPRLTPRASSTQAAPAPDSASAGSGAAESPNSVSTEIPVLGGHMGVFV